MNDPTYIIGLDLGTTNSVLAYTRLDTDDLDAPPIEIFAIPQLVDAGVVETRDMLPSFILLPEATDVPPGALELPWQGRGDLAVGEYARQRGEELPHRLISSSKSWLCNTLVDRKAPILPWSGASESAGRSAGRKLSPVDASAAVLTHIRDSWNHSMASGHSDAERSKMENQLIFLTVPASFDAVARELTMVAAEQAGLRRVTLLEEPQAAFYAWISGSEGRWRDAVTPDDLVLVCDVGGGTSDFSLIRVDSEDGDLVLDRMAVGRHLLIGGDNMDLALAHSVAAQLAQSGTRLDGWQIKGLWHSCRKAKERLLTDLSVDQVPVTVLGRGSRLIGGTITTQVTRAMVEQILLAGFLPSCTADDKPQTTQQAGIQELGLAYEQDPAITRHLADFLDRRDSTGEILCPTAVLFNGGVMKATQMRRQIADVLGGWCPAAGLREIATADFDLAVARGAAYYGLARQGKGVRIRGGLGQSYYIGIAASMPAVPGLPSPTKALCVASFGMEEGTTAKISDREFVLLVGRPAVFEFLGSTRRPDDVVGTLVEDWYGDIEPVTTLETTLEGESGQAIPVFLELHVTEVGTLELWCVAKDDDRKWKLEFNVREH